MASVVRNGLFTTYSATANETVPESTCKVMISGVMSHRFSVEPVDHTEQCSVTIFVYNLGRDGNESSCKLDSSLIILCSILLMKLITRRALRPYISRQ